MVIDDGVLVLNRSWVAVHVASVKRAISLVYQDTAKIVSPEDYSTYDFDSWKGLSEAAEHGYIRTVSFKFKVPEIIVLTMFNGLYTRDVKFSRRNIFERDRNICQYCGRRSSRLDLTLDHVIPRAIGGKNTWDNIVVACIPCNKRKGNRPPQEARMPLIREPKKPKWVSYVNLSFGAIKKASWQKFIDTAYWNVELRE